MMGKRNAYALAARGRKAGPHDTKRRPDEPEPDVSEHLGVVDRPSAHYKGIPIYCDEETCKQMGCDAFVVYTDSSHDMVDYFVFNAESFERLKAELADKATVEVDDG